MSFSFLLLCTWDCFFSLFVALCVSATRFSHSPAKVSLHCDTVAEFEKRRPQMHSRELISL